MTITIELEHALASLEPRDDLAPPVAQPLGGAMPVHARTLHAEPDAKVVSGFWRCEPGRSRWDFSDRSEVIHVLDGLMHVQEEGQESVTLRAGSFAAFPKGWRGIWHIEQTISKFFVIYR